MRSTGLGWSSLDGVRACVRSCICLRPPIVHIIYSRPNPNPNPSAIEANSTGDQTKPEPAEMDDVERRGVHGWMEQATRK